MEFVPRFFVCCLCSSLLPAVLSLEVVLLLLPTILPLEVVVFRADAAISPP